MYFSVFRICIVIGLSIAVSGCLGSTLNVGNGELPDSGGDLEFMFDAAPGPNAPGGGGGPGAGQPPLDDGDTEPLPPPPVVASDALYAIPQQTTARVGETVTVLVRTSTTASSLVYLNSVAVTVEQGAIYAPGSYNTGAIGGARDHKDGYWGQLLISGFLGMPDALLVGREQPISDTHQRITFNVSPIGSFHDSILSGDLFNFGLQFNEPGTYTLGFQLTSDSVDRTYYSDSEGLVHYWGDISNFHQGIANRITVTE